MMRGVIGGLVSDPPQSDTVQVLCPTYYAPPGLEQHRDGTSFERSVRSTVRGLMGEHRPDATLRTPTAAYRALRKLSH